MVGRNHTARTRAPQQRWAPSSGHVMSDGNDQNPKRWAGASEHLIAPFFLFPLLRHALLEHAELLLDRHADGPHERASTSAPSSADIRRCRRRWRCNPGWQRSRATRK
jgi:hypothetical protein